MLGNLFGDRKAGSYIKDPFGMDEQFGGTTTEWNTDMPIPSQGPFDFSRNNSSPFSGENALKGFKALFSLINFFTF